MASQNENSIEKSNTSSSPNEEKVNVTFGTDENEETNIETEVKKDDLSRYTVVDHLDEDEPIRGQEYCLFSFLSPEGVMNCNIRALKFRGAYSNIDDAKAAARELEKKDKYFKIFIGDSGKWLDFDPPSSRVEMEISSNKEHQKIIDAQRKQRMNKINALAGKHKEMLDKKDKGIDERKIEAKKAGAASDAVEKQRAKKTESR